MYLESIGNPRKFTRLARRTAAAKPLVVVQVPGTAAWHPRGTPYGRRDCPTRRSPRCCGRPA